MTKTIETTTDKYFDEYTRNARLMFSWVYPSEIRAILDKTVDLQVETGKYLTKTLVDNMNKLSTPAK